MKKQRFTSVIQAFQRRPALSARSPSLLFFNNAKLWMFCPLSCSLSRQRCTALQSGVASATAAIPPLTTMWAAEEAALNLKLPRLILILKALCVQTAPDAHMHIIKVISNTSVKFEVNLTNGSCAIMGQTYIHTYIQRFLASIEGYRSHIELCILVH